MKKNKGLLEINDDDIQLNSDMIQELNKIYYF